MSDEEFEAEKRRLLDGGNVPARERVIEVEVEDEGSGRTAVYWLLGAGGIALAVGLGLLLGRTVSGDRSVESVNGAAAAPLSAEAPGDVNLLSAAPAPIQDVRSLTESEQLARAFAAAFGTQNGANAQVSGQGAAYRPGKIIWIGDRAVLISAAAAKGVLAVHYLRAAGDRFEVTGAWPDLAGAGSAGAPKWRLSGAFTSFPALFAEGRGAGQGASCTSATLIELAPAGPVSTGPVRLHYDKQGAGAAEPVTIDGRIGNVKKDTSFDVTYSGAQPFVETWVRSDGRFVPQGGQSPMPQC